VRDQSGFTLAEMLVVMVILALIMGISLPYLQPHKAKLPIDQLAEKVIQEINGARFRAVQHNRTVSLSLEASDLSRSNPLEDGNITVVSERNSAEDILFFPDGTASDTRIELAQSGRIRIIKVNRHNGSIEVTKEDTK
jgi:prepilin-type N-terminal cleavage/methylation domain-containing protein